MALNPNDPRHVITSESFGVTPELLGAPLARPWRRALAMAVDGILVAILAKTGPLVLAVVAAGALWKASRSRPESTGFVRGSVRMALRTVAAVMAFIVVVNLAGKLFGDGDGDQDEGWDEDRREAPDNVVTGVPPSRIPAEVQRMLDSLESPEGVWTGEEGEDSARIAELERTNQELRQENRGLEAELEEREGSSFVAALKRFVDEDLGIGFGWGALYFTGFLAMWNGRTPGKRLMGLRIIRLNGAPISWFIAFERFGGYAASLSIGLLGFAQILWDRNRQGLHDKAVETVVVLDLPRKQWAATTGGFAPMERERSQAAPPPASVPETHR